MTAPPETLPERDEIEMLLPWYVTGRLPAADAARVEAALAADPMLRRQVDLIREDRHETTAANEAIAAPRTLSPAAVLDRIQAKRRSSAAGLLGGLREAVQRFFTMPTAGAVRFAAGVAAVVLLAQAVTIGGLVLSRTEPAYVTASGETQVAAVGTTVIVRFADGATAKAIADGLRPFGGRIIDGPKPGGLFVIRIGDASMPAMDRDRITTLMRSNQTLFSFVSAQ